MKSILFVGIIFMLTEIAVTSPGNKCTYELSGSLQICPGSEQISCIWCNDNCQTDNDCQNGAFCCLNEGCGKECSSVNDSEAT
ncbi:hypothetical protein Bhyg_16656 [Pseudolycoriella hygida]|uniref:WAP domain-containing protein n=1 Tax=Pseudolycoriella hygida TaxID=35572 RepID=A0A9Q0ML57_9DIPT|nr:hypothetical protein Bhyg_16656 [Pseudolycoriella hygida]